MPNRSFPERLLSLFATRDVAESIVGDLAEQRRSRVRGWFTLEVVRIAVALCLRALSAAPRRALGLAVLGVCVYGGLYLLLFVVSGLPWYPWHRVNEPGFWVRLGLVIVAANFLTGAILARRRTLGAVNPVAPLAALWLALWLLAVVALALVLSVGFWRGLVPWRAAVPHVWAITSPVLLFPVLYQLPLLLGALVVQPRRDHPLSRTA